MAHSKKHRLTIAGIACACASAFACDSRAKSEATSDGITVRDSAGVEIVDHSAAALAALPQWTIDSVPLVHIAGDAAANAFTNIRAVIQRTNGKFVVVEGRAREIREYSAAGAFEKLVTRGGKGPGEIEYVSRLQLTPDDSLVVFDGNQRRASVFGPQGNYVRQITYPRFADGSRFTPLGLLSDNRLLGALRASQRELVETTGPVRRELYAIARIANVGELTAPDSARVVSVDTVAIVPEVETYPTAMPSGGKSYPEMDFLIFGRQTNIAMMNRGLYVSTNVTNEIEQYDDNGVIRRIRNQVVPAAVTPAIKEQVHTDIKAMYEKSSMSPAQRAGILEYLLTQRRIADTFAFNETLNAGSDSTLWVEEPRITDQAARTYVAYGANGRALARVRFPERIVPHSFSRERMLGVWLDADDVPHVMLWKIVPAKQMP